jgi:hypothetical protein
MRVHLNQRWNIQNNNNNGRQTMISKTVSFRDIFSRSKFLSLSFIKFLILGRYLPRILSVDEHWRIKCFLSSRADLQIEHILGEKENKSSLKSISTTLCQFGKPHSTWSFVRDNPSDVQKAAIKTRILTGCYTLQANRSKFNQY